MSSAPGTSIVKATVPPASRGRDSWPAPPGPSAPRPPIVQSSPRDERTTTPVTSALSRGFCNSTRGATASDLMRVAGRLWWPRVFGSSAPVRSSVRAGVPTVEGADHEEPTLSKPSGSRACSSLRAEPTGPRRHRCLPVTPSYTSTLQPVPPNAVCHEAGGQIICDTFIDDVLVNEPNPDFALPCGTVLPDEPLSWRRDSLVCESAGRTTARRCQPRWHLEFVAHWRGAGSEDRRALELELHLGDAGRRHHGRGDERQWKRVEGQRSGSWGDPPHCGDLLPGRNEAMACRSPFPLRRR